MGKYKDIDAFIYGNEHVYGLANIDPPNRMSLNIYHGKGGNPEIRRENLRFYLEEMRKSKPTRLFVGEAPGRWGCFQTGIPFTDINTLIHNCFFKGRQKQLKESELRPLITSFDKKEKEMDPEISSKCVWECLKQLQDKGLKLPLLWNIYPFHPSEVTNEYVLAQDRPNRHPNAKERELGMRILFDLLKCFSIKEIYTVGTRAKETFEKKFPLTRCSLRHPAYGGCKKFKKQFDEIYQIKPDRKKKD